MSANEKIMKAIEIAKKNNFSYFICHDGYSSLLYMTVEELTEHAKKYSKSYQSDIKNEWTNSLKCA